MYVTIANECWALDAGTGREIWHFQRPRTRGLLGNAAGGINWGVAIAGDRLFMVSDHAHIMALDRYTGDQLWDTEMADWHLNNATSAPLVVGDLVISGTAGGDEGARGFVGCADCSAALEGVAALSAGIRKLAAGASLTMILSPEFLRRAAENGMRIRESRRAGRSRRMHGDAGRRFSDRAVNGGPARGLTRRPFDLR